MRASPVATLGKIAWFALFAFLVVLAVGIELDREGRKNVAAARRVPGLFQGYALETLARDALAKGNAEQGLRLARELIRRRPIPAEGIGLYTNALLATGRGDAAAPALMLAAQRGWRDRYVQRLMVLVGEQTQDWDGASQRLVALWRQGDEGEQTLELTKAIFMHPEGRVAFLEQMGARDRWSVHFLAWAGAELPVDVVRSASAAMAKQRVAIDCSRLAAGSYDLARSGHAQAAAALWEPACAQGGRSAAGDFLFRDLAGPAGPLDWRFPDRQDLTVDLETEADQTRLRYTNTALVRVVIAERFALLGPGAHKVRLNVENTSAARPLQLRLYCFPVSGSPFGLGSYDLNSGWSSIVIPASCPSQRLDIVAARSEGAIQGLEFD